jgi:predicted metal-dependent HD superfamily phosphohydrolase
MKIPAPDYQAAEIAIKHKLESELPSDLTYHGLHHTMDVLQAGMMIAATEKVSEKDLHILRLAIWLHDSGFTATYRGHEEEGCNIARKLLPKYNISEKDIAVVCGLIMATKIPQTPDTLLEKIICDADLDYLGREDVFEIADTLYVEIKRHINKMSEEEWNSLQISFLEAHQYFTKYAKKHRGPAKLKYLNKLKKNKITV